MYIKIFTLDNEDWFRIEAILDNQISGDFTLCNMILGYFPWES